MKHVFTCSMHPVTWIINALMLFIIWAKVFLVTMITAQLLPPDPTARGNIFLILTEVTSTHSKVVKKDWYIPNANKNW